MFNVNTTPLGAGGNPNADNHLSDVGQTYIKCAEDAGGIPRLLAYDDGTGTWTGPWGITRGVRPGQQFTVEGAQALFDAEIGDIEAQLRRIITRRLSRGLWDALVSFAYNNGLGKCQCLIDAINSGDEVRIRQNWMLFVHAKDERTGQHPVWPGLVHRRQSELALWYKIDHDPSHPLHEPDTPLPMPNGPATTKNKSVWQTVKDSPSLRMLAHAFGVVVAVVTGGVQAVSSGVDNLMGQVPAISSSVDSIATPVQSLATSAGIPWEKIGLYVVAAVILTTFLRQLPNKQTGAN